MNRKKLFGILLFIIIGLFTFTFANPNEPVQNEKEKVPVKQEEQKGNTEPVTKEEQTAVIPTTNYLEEKQTEKDIFFRLEDFKQIKIKEMKEYQRQQQLENVEKANQVVEKAVDQINSSTSQKEIEEIVKEVKQQLDQMKKETDLEIAKKTAMEELKNYQKDYFYDEANQPKKDQIVEEGMTNISQADSLEKVKEALETAKKQIDDLIKADLEQFKKKAIEEIQNYEKDTLYSDENKQKVDEIKKESIDKVQNSASKEEINHLVKEAKEKIEAILKLKDTVYEVSFLDFYGNIIEKQNVLYLSSASAPEVNSVTEKGITYSFISWNQDYTNVTKNLEIKANYEITKVLANIYEKEPLGSVELNITNKIKQTILDNLSIELTKEEDEIRSISKETLPILNKLNYKYQYNKLEYDSEKGFYISAEEVLDLEALEKNTVILTYQVQVDGAVLEDGTTQKQVKTYNGENTVTLPKVYKNGLEVAVVWKNEQNEIISAIRENEVYLKKDIVYHENGTLTATLDDTAPVITLKGKEEQTVELSLDTKYEEEGYTATDNFNGDLTANVTTSITLDDVPTHYVDYSVAGIYKITYSVMDTEGNVTTAVRTIQVIDPIKEIKATVYVLKDGITRPNLKIDNEYYDKIGEVNLIINKTRQYLNAGSVIITSDNIGNYIVGGLSSLPQLNEKYYSYECYVIRHEEDGFRIDCEKMFDHKSYQNDLLAELNELLNRDYSIYKDTKTTETYENLIYTVENMKQNMPTEIDTIKKAIQKIKTAIASLVDVTLLRLELSSNQDIYYLNDSIQSFTVTAVYNDTTRNKVLTSNDYQMKSSFDSKTIGKKQITYEYQGKEVIYYYQVNYTEQQLKNKTNSISASLKEKCHKKKCEYKIEFTSLTDDISVKAIQITKDGKIQKNIYFTKVTNTILFINKEEYQSLKNNNTVFANKKIEITYQIGHQEVTVSYYETFNKLHKM